MPYELQPGTLRKTRPMQIYGVWLWEVPSNITETEMDDKPIPQEGRELVHMAPGRYRSLEEVKDKLPHHRMKAGKNYVLAIGKGDHFEAELIRV